MANYILTNGDLVEVALRVRYGVQGALIIRHYVYGNHTTGASTIRQVAIAISNKFEANLVACMSDRAQYLGTWARRIRPAIAVTEFYNISAPAPGLVPDHALPRQTCGLITLRSNIAGPRGRGRAYVPFPAEEDNAVDAQPTNDYVLRLASLATRFGETIAPVHIGDDTGDLVPVIFSRKFNAAVPIVSVSARGRWATQRRRGDYGAPNLYI